MSDWADEIAGKFEPMHVGIGGFRKEIAAALRKAKADGMRESAQMMDDLPTLGQFLCGLELVRAAASKLSPTD